MGGKNNMPYTPQKARLNIARKQYQNPIEGADLSFLIARLVDQYCEAVGLRFQTISDVRGALYGALNEFELRFAQPYEKMKRIENGEVFVFLSERIKECKIKNDG